MKHVTVYEAVTLHVVKFRKYFTVVHEKRGIEEMFPKSINRGRIEILIMCYLEK